MKNNDFLKKRQAATIFFFLLIHSLRAQPVPLHQVFVFGNLADVDDMPAFLGQLGRVFDEADAPFTLLLNGDLVRDKIGETDRKEQIEPIFQLARLVQKYPAGQLIILPGDRDWNSGNRGGEKSLQNLETRVKAYLAQEKLDRCHWAVDDGCPGPAVFEVNDGLVILALNTQWWNHPYDKPRPSDALCEGLTPEILKEALEDAVEEYHDRNVLIAGHHPVFSLGNYGGYFSVGEQLKPFPVIGSFRPAFHANAGNQFDLANARLRVFIENMKNLLYSHDNLIYVSGHEKNQQILSFENNYLLNSGAPVGAQYAAKDKNTVFAARKAGLMELNYFEDGRVDAVFLENKGGGEGFRGSNRFTLFQSGCQDDPPEGIRNTSYLPCRTKLTATATMQRRYPEEVEIAAGPEYEAGWFKRIWFGDHYRSSWTAPVKTHYLDLDETFGGLTIFKKGGGRQTTSLKFKSGNGTVYTFRSVNKDPTKALNYRLRQTIAVDVIRDQTSTQQPYGALAVAPLLDPLGILHADPVLYMLPDDPKLGPFRPKYGNLLGMLEENPGKTDNEGRLFGGAEKIEQSSELFNRFYKNQKTKVDRDEFVRARLFDILIGDWSKHEDNWKWAAYDRDGMRVYRPIPRDRDHAFSRQDGVINWLADRPFGVQNIENFGYKFTGIKSLTFQARHMDRFLAAEAPKDVFTRQVKFIQSHLTDEDIEQAVRNMPPEVYDPAGQVIGGKLKNRLRHLHEAADVYYRLLSKEVDVTGSAEKEFFEVTYHENGSLSVQMFDTDGSLGKGPTLLYERIFYPKETREVRLWGLGNDDVFHFSGSKNKIRVRAFGGPGNDLFTDEASAKTLLYDKGNGTSYQVGGKAKVVRHWNKELYEYNRMRFEYNYSLPIIYVAYSGVTGFGLNFGRNFTIRKFEKDDYHSTHAIGFGLTSEGNKKAAYAGRFHQFIHRWDLLIHATADDPVVRNRFFGAGNDTPNLEGELGKTYYRSKISTYHFSLGLARNFWQKSSFSVKAGFEQNKSIRVENTFLSDNFENIFGAHRTLTMVPVVLSLDLDFRDKKGLPYRGTRALLNYENNTLTGSPGAKKNFGIAKGEFEYYLSTRTRHPLTLGFRTGGSVSHGDVPWYKLPTLGSSHGLRGYVEERFAGESSVFVNTELRYQIVEKNTSVIPIKAGVKAFYDTGRVFQHGLNEGGNWRSGYGFGFYLVPLDEALTFSLTFGFSEEESIYPILAIGMPLR